MRIVSIVVARPRGNATPCGRNNCVPRRWRFSIFPAFTALLRRTGCRNRDFHPDEIGTGAAREPRALPGVFARELGTLGLLAPTRDQTCQRRSPTGFRRGWPLQNLELERIIDYFAGRAKMHATFRVQKKRLGEPVASEISCFGAGLKCPPSNGAACCGPRITQPGENINAVIPNEVRNPSFLAKPRRDSLLSFGMTIKRFSVKPQ